MSGYRLTVNAEFDLSDIWDFTARDSADAAERWIARLYDAFENLARSPGIGHKRTDWTPGQVLFWMVGKYLIIYRIRNEQAEILAVTEGARDIPALIRRRL